MFDRSTAPPQFEMKLRNQTARKDESAVLQCEAKGEKPIGIIWNMNNKRLDGKSDHRLGENACFNVGSSERETFFE